MQERSRRNFLRLSLATVAGIAVGGVMPHVSAEVSRAVREKTGKQTGNAGMRDQIQEDCKKTANEKACLENYQFSIVDKAVIGVISPVIEEIGFRILPSGILSSVNGEFDVDQVLLFGTGGMGMTRRELAFGTISSLVFGVAHNLTDSGFNTNTIPASQILFGFTCWYLQRKLGSISSILTHIVNNSKILGII